MELLSVIKEKKNFVLIGEAGSGKTEIALNLSLAIKGLDTEREVHFFDMDQTKPILRARDSADTLEKEGITLHFASQYLDTPVVASGVIEMLSREDAYVIMDVGGGSHGSHMIGQFSEYLMRENTEVFYIINPYRPWSSSRENIEKTMQRVLGDAHISATSIVANPNFGHQTELDDILEGIKRVEEMFQDVPIKFVAANEELSEEVKVNTSYFVFPLRLNTTIEWLS